MIKDNPNPIANIGFLCYYPFQYFVYKNIYKHLPNAEFIVDDSYRVKGYEFPPQTKERLFSFFAKQNVFWRKLEENDTALTRPELFDKYGLIVNTIFSKEMKEPYIESKKLVRVLYGNAKDPWNFGPWNSYYDLILSYGPYSHKFLNVYENSTMVGNPKFDDWTKISKKTSGRKLKKTILYTPTWGELSSLDDAAAALNALSKEYSITVKAHHMTVLLHPSQLDAYRQNPLITVLDDTDDIVPLLANANIVLSDNSGSIFDAVWANKPVVLINTHDPNLIFSGRRSLIYKKDGKNNGVQTSPESLEQHVKQPETAIGPVINEMINGSARISTQSLRDALREAIAEEKIFEVRRKSIRDQVFLDAGGAVAGERAASAITDLLYRQKKPKNWLAKSIDTYIREYFPSLQYSHEDASLIELGRRYRALKALPRFQRIRQMFEEFFPA